MSWQNILRKEILPDPNADPNDTGATGISPQSHDVTGDPIYDITEHNQHPGKEVHGSGGNVYLLDPRTVDIEGKLSALTAKYGPGWTSLALDGADKGDYMILRDKQ